MKCINCGKKKSLDDFSETDRNVLKKMHSCKQCNADGVLIRLCNIDSYFKHVASAHRSACKARGLAFDLTWQFLKQLYEKQEGKCFYTIATMRTARGQGQSKLSLSVDRVVPENGYVQGNVVLVTKRANLIKNDLTLEEMKNWLPSWYAKLETNGYVS